MPPKANSSSAEDGSNERQTRTSGVPTWTVTQKQEACEEQNNRKPEGNLCKLLFHNMPEQSPELRSPMH